MIPQLRFARILHLAGILVENESRQHQEFAIVSNRVDSTSRPHTPPVTVVSGEFRDFDELAEVVTGWGLDWVQLDHGPLRARIRQVACPSVMLSRFEFGRKFHQRGVSPPGLRTFGLNGSGSPPPEWPAAASRDNEIIVFPANDEFNAISRPGFFGDTVSVSEDRIRQVARRLGVRDPLHRLSGGLELVATGRGLIGALRDRLDSMHRSVETAPCGGNDADWAQAEFDLVALLVMALESGRGAPSGAASPALRTRTLRRALEFIDVHADEAPTIERMSEAAGASWRTLNYAFRERFDLTPKQYLQVTRLQRFRRDLVRSAGAVPISELAAQRGFWHRGQLAADYCRHFGELPSETRARARSS
jgi:AraC family ethanolamine operon transcriptional activator